MLKIVLVLTLMLWAGTDVSAQEFETMINDMALRKQQELADKKLAKRQKEEKKKAEKIAKLERIDTKKSETYTTPVYLFGISAQFGDSVVYVTNLQKLDNAQLTKKYDYLAFRSDYSNQFRKYIVDTYQMKRPVTSVVFHKDRKKALKRFNKILKRYEKSMHLMQVTDDKFQFAVTAIN
ncbi:MAG: hypothetical protein J5720_08375 [Bacteroidaceae bacterium]|nr:hypothetical protein [Bacteroidaceae bacterium]